jgi:hypothetical protein
MKRSLKLACTTAFFAAVAFCADNTLGTWKLVPAKSTFATGQSPISSLTATREMVGDSIKTTVKGEREDKSKIDVSYTAKRDGKPVTVSGSGLPYDTVSMKQVDDNTVTDTRMKKGGAYKATGKFVVSNGGKTGTLTVDGTGPDGKPFHSVSVYEKQ